MVTYWLRILLIVDVKHHGYLLTPPRAQELCESRGGRPGAPSLPANGLCGLKATLNERGRLRSSGLELCESRGGRPPGLPVPPYGLCGRKATLNLNWLHRKGHIRTSWSKGHIRTSWSKGHIRTSWSNGCDSVLSGCCRNEDQQQLQLGSDQLLSCLIYCNS